ncbi:MAG: cytotoxic translational repressor of toxin-antitoxin stability system [Deltaproteobacteria bacterium]|nr:cytotoxic translational repressor of toxin-antitoxin stability system [Deltaproteobacteria bacterium]
MWSVGLTKRAVKQLDSLPRAIQQKFDLLAKELEISGPLRANWPNYSALKGQGQRYHCHIKKGRPTYVACWEVGNKEIKLIEVYYVGTHEKVPY